MDEGKGSALADVRQTSGSSEDHDHECSDCDRDAGYRGHGGKAQAGTAIRIGRCVRVGGVRLVVRCRFVLLRGLRRGCGIGRIRRSFGFIILLRRFRRIYRFGWFGRNCRSFRFIIFLRRFRRIRWSGRFCRTCRIIIYGISCPDRVEVHVPDDCERVSGLVCRIPILGLGPSIECETVPALGIVENGHLLAGEMVLDLLRSRLVSDGERWDCLPHRVQRDIRGHRDLRTHRDDVRSC